MASGSFGVRTSNGYISGRVTWSSTPNTSNNTSTVTATMYLSRTNTGYSTYGSGTFYLTINGNRGSSTRNFTITYNSNTLMVRHSVVVPHNADGTKSISIAWSGSSDVFSVTAGSGTARLDNIPRASVINHDVSWVAGLGRSISITRYSSSFTHTIHWQVKSTSGVWYNVKTATGVGHSHAGGFTETENKNTFIYLAQRVNTECRIKLETFNGSTKIGEYYRVGTCTAPLASTLTLQSMATFNVGDPVSLSVTRHLSSFHHNFKIYVGHNLIATVPSVPPGHSATWTPTTDQLNHIYSIMSNYKEHWTRINVETLYAGVQVRTDTYITGMAYIKDGNPEFTGDFTYKDTNPTTLGITGNDQTIIQGKSTLRVELPVSSKATPVKGASMVEYEAIVEGKSIKKPYSATENIVFDFGTVDIKVNSTLVIRAIDSRGNYTERNKVVSGIPYVPPRISTSVTREGGFGSKTTLIVSGVASPIQVGGANKNNITMSRYRYKMRSSNTYTAWTNLNVTGFPNFSSGNVSLTLNNLEDWDVQVEISDRLGSVVSNTVVPVGRPLMFIDEKNKSFGFNDLPENPNQALFNCNVLVGNNQFTETVGPVEDGTLQVNSAGKAMQVSYSDGKHAYIEWERGNKRDGFVGFPYDKDDSFTISNNRDPDNAGLIQLGPGQKLDLRGGTVKYNGKPIFTSDDVVLWSGAQAMGGGTSIPIKKDIRDCPNGWILLWSRSPGDNLVDNSYWATMVVPKIIGQLYRGSGFTGVLMYTNSTDEKQPKVIQKFVSISGNTIGGSDFNIVPDQFKYRVLRYVLSF